jgi:serine protease DegQ
MRFSWAVCFCLLLAAPTEHGGGLKCDLESKKPCTRGPAEAKVVRVDETGPAAAAGLKFGDVILSLDDQPIRSGKELTDAVRSKQPSSTVRLRVRREDGDRELNLVLGKRPKS